MTSEIRYFAVLTGDLVDSSELSAEDSRSVMGRLMASSRDFELCFPSSIHGRIDTFRHDSWQLLLQEPALALRSAVFLRCSLKSLSPSQDSRVFIGLGEVEEISAERISDSRGDAFSHSGKGLDALEKARMGFSSPLPRFEQCTALAEAVVPLLDERIEEWTAAQSHAVRGALMGWTHEEIAQRWGEASQGGDRITRPAVSKHLRAARWSTFSRVLDWAERELRRATVAS